LLEFGSLFHIPGRPAGVFPKETKYWFDNVLISVVSIADGAAVDAAVAWGLRQGRRNLQLIVFSLLKVILAEVLATVGPGDPEKLTVRVCKPLDIPPRREDGSSPVVHPADGRVLQGDAAIQARLSRTNLYPGLAALINFFDAADRRRSAVKSNGTLPTELYCRIIDYVDHDTWRACSVVSPGFRSYCLFKHRINDEWSILSSSVPRSNTPFLSVNMEETDTGDVMVMDEEEYLESCMSLPTLNWMPVVGEEPRALMVDVLLRYQEVEVVRFGDGTKCDYVECEE